MNGKANSTDQNLRQQDIEQKIKVLCADLMRQRYYESMAADEFRRPDYSFSSPFLAIKRFELTDADMKNMRRADMSGWDMYRLPKNSHLPNFYPVNDGCGNEEVGEITQVAPGEENFYIGDPDLNFLMFCVPKGKGINFYNIPPCIKAIDVEATFDIGEDTEIDMSLASVVIDQLLGVSLGIKKQYYSEEVKKDIQEQNLVK